MNTKQEEIREKMMQFAVKIVSLKKELNHSYKEYNIADQIQRSGTAIGALQREAYFSESEADMIHKLRIALKEACETDYWLELLYHTEYITLDKYECLHRDLDELIRIIASSVNTLRNKSEQQKLNNN